MSGRLFDEVVELDALDSVQEFCDNNMSYKELCSIIGADAAKNYEDYLGDESPNDFDPDNLFDDIE